MTTAIDLGTFFVGLASLFEQLASRSAANAKSRDDWASARRVLIDAKQLAEMQSTLIDASGQWNGVDRSVRELKGDGVHVEVDESTLRWRRIRTDDDLLRAKAMLSPLLAPSDGDALVSMDLGPIPRNIATVFQTAHETYKQVASHYKTFERTVERIESQMLVDDPPSRLPVLFTKLEDITRTIAIGLWYLVDRLNFLLGAYLDLATKT